MDINTLIDCADDAYHLLKKSNYQNIATQLENLERITNSKHRKRISDYKIIARIAEGAFGDVYLATDTDHNKILQENDCQPTSESNLYAIKRILKSTVANLPHTALIHTERNLLTTSNPTKWLIKAKYIFQDEDSIYLVMDFFRGGDFMTWLLSQEKVTEEHVRFYGSEMILAVEEIHRLGFVHRDLKPENILLDEVGHIKIGDFGSAIFINNDTNNNVGAMVGTPDYISPEVLLCQNNSSPAIDLWGLGIIFYEMMYEAPPFWSETLQETYEKIAKFEFVMGNDETIEFKDLISKLICKRESRLTIDKVKKHPFFNGVDWNTVGNRKPPFIPKVDVLANFNDKKITARIRTEELTGDHWINCIGISYDPGFSHVLIKELNNGIETTVLDRNLVNTGVDTNNFEFSNLSSFNSNLVDQNKLNTNEKSCIKQNEKNQEFQETSKNDILGNETLKNEFNVNGQILEIGLNSLMEEETFVLKLTDDEEPNKSNINVEEPSKSNINELFKSSKEASIINLPISNTDSSSNLKEDADMPIIKSTNLLINNIDRSTAPINTLATLKSIESYQNIASLIEEIKLLIGLLETKTRISRENSERDLSSVLDSVDILSCENQKYKNLEIKMQDYKNELRTKKMRTKEIQARLELEIKNRSILEQEIRSLKTEIQGLKKKRIDGTLQFQVSIEKEKYSLCIEDGKIIITGINKDFNISNCINNVIVRVLKQNELFHLPVKERNLMLNLTMIDESQIKCTPSKSNLSHLENELKKEENIKLGIEKIMKLTKLDESAMEQLEGSKKRIAYLKQEIKLGRGRSEVDTQIDNPDSCSILDFNNHSFVTKSFYKQMFCDHCDDILRGVVNQGLECLDCKMTVHKVCYVLSDISCELFRAIRKGKRFYLTMRNIEEKEKFVKFIKGN